jgi:hypothetical protein
MIMLLVVVIALLCVDVARLSVPTRGDLGAGLLGAFPRALLPVALATAVGAWQLRAAFEGVAASGTGGVGSILPAAAELAGLTFGSVVGVVCILGTALAASWWHGVRTGAPGGSAPLQPAARWALVAGVGAAAIGCGWIVVEAVRAAVAAIAQMVGPAGVAVPPRYAALAAVSGRTLAGMLTRFLRVGFAADVALGAGLAVLVVVTAAVRRRATGGPAFVNTLRAAAVGVMAAAGWYGLTSVLAAAAWLRGLTQLSF